MEFLEILLNEGISVVQFLKALRPKWKTMLKQKTMRIRRNFMTINLIKICVNQHLD